MVLGKVYRVWHRVDSVYSVLFEKRNDKDQSLLFEAEVISTLSALETDAIKSHYNYLCDAYGCLGVLQLPLGDSTYILYLVLVKGCVSVGKIDKSEIFRITDTEFISLRNNSSDEHRIKEIRGVLNSGTFYFSWSAQENEKPFDLTLCAQRKLKTNETDNRFFWNRIFHLQFIRYGVETDRWLLKALCGSVAISTVYVGHQQARACLISRLSSERAGTRFNVRGVDDDGSVANFVETEQCIFLEDKVVSYIMLRGSVPLFWEQPGYNVGSHKIKMSRGVELSQPAFDRHVALLRKRYGKSTFINLMGSKEGEAMLTKMYKSHHKACCLTKDIPLVCFDYHAHCPRGRQDYLDKLEKHFAFEIRHQLKDFSFFSSGEGLESNFQNGCFRINCVDCLDRTNCVETFIGLNLLKQQLSALKLMDKVNIISRFEETFKNMWITNGDQISRIYAGTGALEGKSKIKDSTLTVARTIQNNLLDNSKQEAFDILLFGKSSSHEYSDKARSLLPSYYLHLPNSILIAMCDRYLEYTEPVPVKITVGTWNVNGGKHFTSIVYRRSDPLSDWLLDYKAKRKSDVNIMDMSLNDSMSGMSDPQPDFYAIGFEEIVDLNASNIVAASTSNQREWLVEIQKTISRDSPYVLITCEQLVGVCLFLFVKPHHAPFIRDVAVDTVKTGLGGATGNKGGVAIRMLFHNTSLCFVCAHFAAGQSQIQDRNADYSEIVRKSSFPSGRSLNCHDYIFWCGDFNYRIDLDNDRVKECVRNEDWETLLANEQLKVQQSKGKVFRNYIEGKIDFAPTYKYDIESDDYDTSEKCRVPAYTDRILFKKRFATRLGEDTQNLNQGDIIFYGRCELKTSDHRPVIGEYDIEILKVNEKTRERIFSRLIEISGPRDSCVLVKHEAGIAGFNDTLVKQILKLLADEGGEVVMVRLGDSHLTIHFRESISALKVSKSSSIKNLDDGLHIELRTPNWVEMIRKEMSLGMNNTVPLCESTPTSSCVEFDNILTNKHDYGISQLSSNVLCVDDNVHTIVTPLGLSPSPTCDDLSSSNNDIIPSTLISSQNKNGRAGPPPKPPPPSTSNSSVAKPMPTRPAPPPPMPTSAPTIDIPKPDTSARLQYEESIDADSSFDTPPPAIPAPPPPLEKSSEDFNDPWNERKSSCGLDGVSNNGAVTKEFSSNFHQPANGSSRSSDSNISTNESPPAIPQRPSAGNPPPIPARRGAQKTSQQSSMTPPTGNPPPIGPPPVIPPRRAQ